MLLKTVSKWVKYKQNMGKAKFQIERRCEVCGNPFFAKTLESRYCSEKCGQVAYTRRKREAKKLKKLQEITEQIDDDRNYITVPEAVAIYSVSRTSLYQYIHDGSIPSINLGVRLIRVSRKELEKFFPKRNFDKKPVKRLPKLYNLEPENCYTIGEISKKYKIDDSTVYLHIRKYGIPTRQIGNYVYVPKYEIDNLYK